MGKREVIGINVRGQGSPKEKCIRVQMKERGAADESSNETVQVQREI